MKTDFPEVMGSIQRLALKDRHGRWIYQVTKRIAWEPFPGFLIEIEPGYLTNLASIPWWALWLFKPEETPEAIFHDKLRGESISSQIDGPMCSRPLADGVLWEAMSANGRSLAKRLLFFFSALFHGFAKTFYAIALNS